MDNKLRRRARKDAFRAAQSSGGDEQKDSKPWHLAMPTSEVYLTKENFEDFPTVVYWLRQPLGLILGIVWGLLGLTGMTALGSYGVTQALVLWFYYTKLLRVDAEDFKPWDLLKEGFVPAFGLFLTAWIVTHSLIVGVEQPVVADIVAE